MFLKTPQNGCFSQKLLLLAKLLFKGDNNAICFQRRKLKKTWSCFLLQKFKLRFPDQKLSYVMLRDALVFFDR